MANDHKSIILPNMKNVLLITSDQQHWTTLGVLNPAIKTPNLDRLAAMGTLFERAYCPNPTCTPTRASIITGLYPSQHGAYTLGTKLPETVPTIGADFSAAGVHTALIGKAHFQPLKSTADFPSLESYPILQDLDFWRDYEGPFYGFDQFELARNHTDEAHVGQHYALWMEKKGLTNWRDHYRKPTGHGEPQYGAWSIPEEYHYNSWITERSIGCIDDCVAEEKPFFLWASYFDPHPSYLVPEPWASMYDPDTIELPRGRDGEHAANPPHFQKTQEMDPDFSDTEEPDGSYCHGLHSHLRDEADKRKDMAIYYGMISFMDHSIGQLLDHLDAKGLTEDTLVVFTSDHGHLYGQHGLIAKGPFHYEDLLKVPFIASCPGTVAEGRRCQALQSLVDLAPTFYDFLGLPVPRRLAGVNQLKVWQGSETTARRFVSAENKHQPTKMNLRTTIDARYKITMYGHAGYGELFDLKEDPGEFENLWDSPEHHNLKTRLLMQFVQAEMEKEPVPMPRVFPA